LPPSGTQAPQSAEAEHYQAEPRVVVQPVGIAVAPAIEPAGDHLEIAALGIIPSD
jgi:hypothetical protein